MAIRSTNSDDYQTIRPPVAVLARDYEHGSVVTAHTHPRAQLLYAIRGMMRVTTPACAWLVPPQRAIWIAPHVPHAITHIGHVSMRTAYIAAERNPFAPDTCHVLAMTPLIRELILRLLEEPVEYALEGAPSHIAELILLELSRLARLPLHIALPQDKRLMRVCDRILKRSGENGDLQFYADLSGTSPRNLQRLFHKEFAMTFGAWRQQVRLLDALAALSSGERISTVAKRLEYQSASAFTAMFRRNFGVAPTEFIKHLKTET